LRITGQLIVTETGAHVWADRFEGALEDVFTLQDEVTEKVIAAIAPGVEQAEIERALRKPTANLSAHDWYLRASAVWWKASRDSNREAMRLLKRSLELDPDHSSAMGLLIAVHANRRGYDSISDAEREDAEVKRLVRQAVGIGRDDAVALAFAAFAIAYVLRDVVFAEEQAKRALMLNPNLAIGWLFSGWIHLWSGNAAEALSALLHAKRLDPMNETPRMKNALANVYFFLDRHDDVLRLVESQLQQNPDSHPPLRLGAASAAVAGRLHIAQKLASRLMQVDPAFRVSRLDDYVGPYRAEFLEKLKQGMLKAGLPE
jgi:adenylate cyclase